jgi:tripartite-type tricarboxylate transporter receptor subunit TctC
MVPQGTPRPVVEQINRWFVQANQTEESRKFLANLGADPLIETPDAAQARFVKDIDVWGEYVRVAKIQPQG